MDKITISISKSNSKNPSFHYNFKTVDVPSIQALCDIVRSAVYAPAVFKNGYRIGANFVSQSIVALDFDTGTPTLSEMVARLETSGVSYLVATTKSHQKTKLSGHRTLPAVDRYRVLLPLGESLAQHKAQFKCQMKRIQARFPGCDRACSDNARFFFPSIAVVSYKDTGKFFKPPIPPSVEKLNSALDDYQKRLDRFKACGSRPPWLRQFLQVGAPRGERHKTILAAAATMTRLGYRREDIFSIISNVPIDRGDIDNTDFMRHIENGIKLGKSK